MSEYAVAKYLRLSSEDTDLHGSTDKLESNSISNQRNLLDSYIKTVPEFTGARILEFCDDGWSGKNFERPGVQDMLAQVRQGKVNCILVKDLSRFGRDYLTVGNYISRVFPFLGVRFIAVNDGIDSIRPMDVDSLETSFKALLYDLYSKDLSRKVRAARKFRAERGDFLSAFAPYGYIKDPKNKGRLIVDPEAAKNVRDMFLMVADGYSVTQIAESLNARNVLTPMQYKKESGCSRTTWPCVSEDNFWTTTKITSILRDERYIGKTVYGKRTRDRVGHWHTVKVQRDDWIVVDQRHEGIVTEEEFKRAQDSMRAYVEFTGAFHHFPLGRKVKCGICGHVMARSNSKHPYYYCKTRYVTNRYSCPTEKVYESDLLDSIMIGLRVQSEVAVEAEFLLAELRKKQQSNKTVILKDLDGLRERKRRLDKQIKDLYDSFVLDGISKNEYLTQKKKLSADREEVTQKITQMEKQLELSVNDGSDNEFIKCFKQYQSITELSTEIATDVLKDVLIYPDNAIEIRWNHQEAYEKLLVLIESAERDKKAV